MPGQGSQLCAFLQLGAPGSGTAGITTGRPEAGLMAAACTACPRQARAWSWFWSQISTVKGTQAQI